MKKLKVPKLEPMMTSVLLVGVLLILGAMLWCPDPPETDSELTLGQLVDKSGDTVTIICTGREYSPIDVEGDDVLIIEMGAEDTDADTGSDTKILMSASFADKFMAVLGEPKHAISRALDVNVGTIGRAVYLNVDTIYGYRDHSEQYRAFLKTNGCNANDPESAGCKDLYKKSRHLMEVMVDEATDKLGETSALIDVHSNITDKNVIETFGDKLVAIFGDTDSDTDTDTDSEQKPDIVMAGFGAPTVVVFFVFALLAWGFKQRDLQPALATSQKMVGGIEGSGSSGFPSFVMICENGNDSEAREARKAAREGHLYGVCVNVFNTEAGNEDGRNFLRNCLLDEHPHRAELIKKAFEDTAEAT